MATIFTNRLAPFSRTVLDGFAFVKITGKWSRDFINAAVNEAVLRHAVAVLYDEYPKDGDEKAVLVMCAEEDAGLLTVSLNNGKDAERLSVSLVPCERLSRRELAGILVNSVAKRAGASNALGHVMIRIKGVCETKDEMVFLDFRVGEDRALTVKVVTFTRWLAFTENERRKYAHLPKYGMETGIPIRLREGDGPCDVYVRKKTKARQRKKNRVGAYKFGKKAWKNKVAFLTRLENALLEKYPGVVGETIFESIETNEYAILEAFEKNAKLGEYERLFFEESAKFAANARFNFVFVSDGESNGDELMLRMREGILKAIREFVPDASPTFDVSNAPVSGALNVVLIPYGREHYKKSEDDPHFVPDGYACQHIVYREGYWKDACPGKGKPYHVLLNELVSKMEILRGRSTRFLMDGRYADLEIYARFTAPKGDKEKRPKAFVGGIVFDGDGNFSLSFEPFEDFILRETFCDMDEKDLSSFECIAVKDGKINVIETTGIVGIPSRPVRKFILEENLKEHDGYRTERGKGVRGMYGAALLDALCRINRYSGEDGHFYAVSNVEFSNGGLRQNYDNFQKIFRRVKPIFGTDAFVLEDWFMRLFEPNWVRADMEPTVWPFPVKYVREYMKMKMPALFEEENGAEGGEPTAVPEAPAKKRGRPKKDTNPRRLSLFAV